MTEDDLDEFYSELCRALSAVGAERAPLLLARFALLAVEALDDRARARQLLASARDLEGVAGQDAAASPAVSLLARSE